MINTNNITVKRIDIHNQSEVMNWCEAFGCTEKQLAEAINSVGSVAAAVRKHLDFLAY